MNDHWIYHVKLWEVKCVIMFVHVLAGLLISAYSIGLCVIALETLV